MTRLFVQVCCVATCLNPTPHNKLISTLVSIPPHKLFLPKNNSPFPHFSVLPLLCFHFIITISTTTTTNPSIKITSLLVFRMSGGKTLPGNLETRSIFDEFRSFDTGGYFDLGHPLLNRIAHSFIKAAGIGAVQAVSREAYFVTLESAGLDSSSNGVPDIAKKQRLPNFRGENNRKSLEAMVKNTGKESLQWGLAAGMYSGLTYGLKETRGSHDWTNSAVAGAITGATMALTTDDHSHEKIVQYAITGAAISAAANLLTGIF